MATSQGRLIGWFLTVSLCASASACGKEDQAPFFDPRDDGGVNSGNPAGNDDGPSGNTGGSGAGNNFLGRSGDPAIFDPEQIYVRGGFAYEGLNATNAFAGPCDDAPSIIANWSSPKDDLDAPLGMIAATTCGSEEFAVRVDGSITYMIAGQSAKIFLQEEVDVSGSTVVFDMGRARPHDNDIEHFRCFPVRGPINYWLHPETGEMIVSCWLPPDDAPVLAHQLPGSEEIVEVPSGWTMVHMGIQDYVLMREVLSEDNPAVDTFAVWNRDDDSLVEVPLEAFPFEGIYAVRATPTGFLVLQVNSADPVALTLWEIAYDGAIVGPLRRIEAPNHRLDNSNCDRVPFGSPAGESPEYLPIRGCLCAIEGSESVVCIVEDARGDENPQVVIRFDAQAEAAAEPEVVFDPADDEFLTRVSSLFTGD